MHKSYKFIEIVKSIILKGATHGMFDFVKYLSSDEKSCISDKKIFIEWENGQLSTYGVMNKFKINNPKLKDHFIEPRVFEMWLRSLGYIRN